MMTRKFGAAVALVITAASAWLPVSASAAGASDFGAIDSYVARSLAGAPGFGLSVVRGDQVVHVKTFGAGDGRGAPLTPDTPLAIGSETKSFTALAVVQLAEAGDVSLDAPVRRYLPWFRIAGSDGGALITIRQLLVQTSGLPPSAPFDTPVTSIENRVHDLANVRPTAAPGGIFQYSNSNYDVLGLVIEAVSGESYAAYMNEHVFQPLDMPHTHASKAAAAADGLGSGHQWWFGLPVEADTYRADYIPAGYLLSSIGDMGHYLVAQLNGGAYAGRRVLSDQGVAEMHRGVTRYGGGLYAMGWGVYDLSGVQTVSHDGDSLNMHSDMILVPSRGWAVQVIANADSLPVLLAGSIEATAQGVVEMLLGSASPFTPSPLGTYAVFDLLMLAMLGFQAWSLVRAATAASRPAMAGALALLRRVVLPAGWRLAAALVAFGLLSMLAAQLGSSLRVILGTDLGVALSAFAVLLLANGGLRAARALRARPRESAGTAGIEEEFGNGVARGQG